MKLYGAWAGPGRPLEETRGDLNGQRLDNAVGAVYARKLWYYFACPKISPND
jgi:hypothetical protein